MLSTDEKILSRLDTGLNVYVTGSSRPKDSRGEAFDPIGLASGGIFMAKEGLAMLHGPEVVAPLHKLPQLAASFAPRGQGAGAGGRVDLNVNIPVTRVMEAEEESEMAMQLSLERILRRAFSNPDVLRDLVAALKAAGMSVNDG